MAPEEKEWKRSGEEKGPSPARRRGNEGVSRVLADLRSQEGWSMWWREGRDEKLSQTKPTQ